MTGRAVHPHPVTDIGDVAARWHGSAVQRGAAPRAREGFSGSEGSPEGSTFAFGERVGGVRHEIDSQQERAGTCLYCLQESTHRGPLDVAPPVSSPRPTSAAPHR